MQFFNDLKPTLPGFHNLTIFKALIRGPFEQVRLQLAKHFQKKKHLHEIPQRYNVKPCSAVTGVG